MRCNRSIACLFAAPGPWLAPAPAPAQPEVLFLDEPAARFNDYELGARAAVQQQGGTLRKRTSIIDFLNDLRTQRWDCVLVLRYNALGTEFRQAFLDELRAHLDAGGTMAITYTHLDEWPELQDLLGVASAVDPVGSEAVVATEPWHPAWLGTGRLGIDTPPGSIDFGDILTPGPSGRVIGVYEDSGAPVMLETRGGQLIVNGLEWDDWEPGRSMGRAQTRYLTTCIPDFDDDGVLDFFDFLAYQNAFAAGDPRADLTGGGTLTFFDFLAFQDVFAYGCPRH